VLDEGHVIERGTHKQLLDLEGLYYKTYRNQYADQPAAGREDAALSASAEVRI
jgi:ABC-type transport system involved in cytochrome bd biosynthesis fused ATPase/permease subunit